MEIERKNSIGMRNQLEKLAILRQRQKVETRGRKFFSQITQRRLAENDTADSPEFDEQNAIARCRFKSAPQGGRATSL